MEVSRILKRPAGSDIESVKIRPHNGGVCALHAGGDVCPLQAGPGGFGGADMCVQGTLAESVHDLDSVIAPSP